MTKHDKIRAVLGIAVVILFIWAAVVSAEQHAQRLAWLRAAAEETNGSLEREATGESAYTDSKGNYTGSSVNWHYYVRSGNGKRIEYGDNYDKEKTR